MTLSKAYQKVMEELTRAIDKYPKWPADPIHAAAIVVEEAGELQQASLDHCYSEQNHKGKNTKDRLKNEAIQTAAMAIRFLINIDSYHNRDGYGSEDSETTKI